MTFAPGSKISSNSCHEESKSNYNYLNRIIFWKKLRLEVVCFAATQRPNSLIPSLTLTNTFFTSNSEILTPTTQTYFF